MEFTLNYREDWLAGYLKKSYGIGEWSYLFSYLLIVSTVQTMVTPGCAAVKPEVSIVNGNAGPSIPMYSTRNYSVNPSIERAVLVQETRDCL